MLRRWVNAAVLLAAALLPVALLPVALLPVVLLPGSPAWAADCATAGRLTDETPWSRGLLAIDDVVPLSRGGGVTVAVLSTGVLAAHPQLRGHVLGAATTDCAGIGTQVAGVIAARESDADPVIGLASRAEILAIRVAADDGTTGAGELATGINDAVRQGAAVIVVAAPVYQDSRRLRNAVADAVAADVAVVAAAGERGDAAGGNPVPYPAAYPDVIGVGAIDRDGRILATSGHGEYVDLVAPGVDVPTLQGGDAGGVVEADGTAVAAGFVGATVALVQARTGERDVARLTRTLLATASPAVTGEAFGAGVVNPYAAITGHATTARARALPGVSAVAPERTGAENRRRAVALTGAAVAAIVVVVVLMVGGAVRRSRRRHWRPGLAAPLPRRVEPVEPGPPVMLLAERITD
ncbi:S8 family serine peptidase [Actinoplanes sp. NPDC051851]|uniref:S8 family serine peptidase n=1 Tax=Actinoplanes sp. NPDC051851 TaxID=3154753 RepID=UPI0034214261